MIVPSRYRFAAFACQVWKCDGEQCPHIKVDIDDHLQNRNLEDIRTGGHCGRWVKISDGVAAHISEQTSVQGEDCCLPWSLHQALPSSDRIIGGGCGNKVHEQVCSFWSCSHQFYMACFILVSLNCYSTDMFCR